MAKSLQQFWIYKFTTRRLKETNYKIPSITPTQARVNGELISISESEMIRQLFRITNREFSRYKLDSLNNEKRRISKKANSKESRKELDFIISQIEDLLFIPQIVSLEISNKKHYQTILKNGGFSVNGKIYVPFIFSAGLIRRNSGLFIEKSLKSELISIFENGRKSDYEMSPAKYNSYMGLYSSSTFPVTFPRIAVVPDLVMKLTKRVDFGEYIAEGIDPKVEEKDVETEYNFFDGCGLVSPTMAKKWSKDLDLDYIPSTFGVRCSWLKGMTVVMDFHKFADEIAETHIIKDLYGNNIDIMSVDVIVSASMFKLCEAYENTQTYMSFCKESDISWGISKFNPKTEKDNCKTSYQFLQPLVLTDTQISELCKPTISWLDYVSGSQLESTLLYALGDLPNFEKGWLSKIEPVYQALLLENSLINDDYLISHLDKSLNKKKNDSKKGTLYLNGNYQAAIPDPYLYCRYIFGMELIPFLKDGESYSYYWYTKNVNSVVGIRSPIVFQSEIIKLDFKYDAETLKWFEHIKSGIVLPANGITLNFALAGGMDADYDLIATINNNEMLNGRTGGLPVIYNTVKSPKNLINEDTENLLYEAQLRGLNTRVGFFTNVSSTYYSMLYNYSPESKEYMTIMQRLKWLRAIQGLELDRQKGLVTPPFPEHWTKYKKIKDDENIDEIQYNNSLLADKRPYFFIYLYPHYMKKYKREKVVYDNICLTRYDISFAELTNSNHLTQEQKDILDRYKRKTYFIDNNSTMNRICHHMENELKNTKIKKKNIANEFDYKVLLSDKFKKPIKRDMEKVSILYKEYKSLKRDFASTSYKESDDERYSNMEQIYRYIRNKALSAINSNEQELTDLIIYCVYEMLGVQSKSFLWNCFGRNIVNNIRSKYKERFVRIPVPKENGKIQYLWKNYSNYLISIEE